MRHAAAPRRAYSSAAPPHKPPPTPSPASHTHSHGCSHHHNQPAPANRFKEVNGKPVSPYTLSEYEPLPPNWPFNDPNYDPAKPMPTGLRPPSEDPPPQRAPGERRKLVLNLYRTMRKASLTMPTDTRRKWLHRKIRHDFRSLKDEKDDQKVEFGIRLAEVSLDTIQIQAKHLQQLFSPSPAAQQKEKDRNFPTGDLLSRMEKQS